MEIQEVVVQFVVILGFGIWAYSKVKRQEVSETIEEIKGLIRTLQGNG